MMVGWLKERGRDDGWMLEIEEQIDDSGMVEIEEDMMVGWLREKKR
jgi:hypothetical protein